MSDGRQSLVRKLPLTHALSPKGARELKKYPLPQVGERIQVRGYGVPTFMPMGTPPAYAGLLKEQGWS